MNKKLKTILISVGVLVAVGGAVGFYYPFANRERTLQLPGTVETQEVRLSSKVGGRVKKVAVQEGDMVKPGQPLVVFESPELEAQRDQLQAKLQAAEAARTKAYNGARIEEKALARAAVDSAKARLDKLTAGFRVEEIDQARFDAISAEANCEQALKDWNRERSLYPGSTSKASIDQAEANYFRLKGLLESAKAKLKMMENGSRVEEIAEAGAELQKAQANLDLLLAGTRAEDLADADAKVAELRARLLEVDVQLREAVVVAPEKAVVEVVAVRPGDVVGPNQPVVRVLRADDLWVKTFVSEVDLGKVSLHQTVTVTCDSHPGMKFQGTVVQIAAESEFTPRNVQSIDERRHQVFAVKVRVADPKGVFKSGMAADVYLTVQ
jgi:multidrug resistance efflux pump